MNISIPVTGVALLACAGVASALTVETLPTHNVFYAGVENQACLRLKVTATAGESITTLTFSTANTTLPSNIKAAHLYSSGTAPFFSPNTKEGCAKSTKLASSSTASVGTMTFSAPIALSAGDNYLWLVYDISSTAKGGNKIAAECLAVTDGAGGTVMPVAGASGNVTATVYPFKYRIAPYYRPRWIVQYYPGHLNATHFKYLTDLIFFGVRNNGTEIVPQWDVGSEEQEIVEERLAEALEKVKDLRGKTSAKIVLGLKNGEEITAVMDDENRRNELVANLAHYIIENGYEGVNIDWEYPKDGDGGAATNWNNLSYFLASLREKLAGTGTTISLAITPWYDLPPSTVLDQSDYVCTMSYDSSSADGHSTLALAKSDIATMLNAGVPKQKVIVGLPFYSNSLPLDWNENQVGYNTILSYYPKISASANTFVHPTTKKTHYFNGATLIKEKCKYVVQQGVGGVMIWAYDCDALLTNAKSLAKAMYSVIKQTKR